MTQYMVEVAAHAAILETWKVTVPDGAVLPNDDSLLDAITGNIGCGDSQDEVRGVEVEFVRDEVAGDEQDRRVTEVTVYSDPPPPKRTDHSAVITSLRLQAGSMKATRLRNRLLAAAALLETHDATGINLCEFGAVGAFVNDVIAVWYDDDVTVENNGA